MTASTQAAPGSNSIRPILVLAGFVFVVVGLLGLALCGIGYRHEMWSLHAGLLVFRYAGFVVWAGVLVSLAALLSGRSRPFLAVVSLVLGVLGGGIWVKWIQTAKTMPPIHDITTDTDNPPTFVEMLPRRAGSPNSAEYGGPDIAAKQKAAFPDIVPLMLPADPDHAFHAARELVGKKGWQLVGADSIAGSGGRIEATATTQWFGFKDDVVIRVEPAPSGGSGTRVDMRSVSRVGGGDVGTNASRIRSFLQDLKGSA
jgi:uncharacterized protein (DUF1499 family)